MASETALKTANSGVMLPSAVPGASHGTTKFGEIADILVHTGPTGKPLVCLRVEWLEEKGSIWSGRASIVQRHADAVSELVPAHRIYAQNVVYAPLKPFAPGGTDRLAQAIATYREADVAVEW